MSALSKVGDLATESVGRTATLVRHAYGKATTILVCLLVALITRDLVAYGSTTGLSAMDGIWIAARTTGVMQIVSTVSCLVVAAVVLLAIVGGVQCFHLTRHQATVRAPKASVRSAVHATAYWLGIAVATLHTLVWPWLECNAGGAFEQADGGYVARPLVESWAFPLLAWVRVKVNWMVGLGVSFVVTTFFAKLWGFIHGRESRPKETSPTARPGDEPTETGHASPTDPHVEARNTAPEGSPPETPRPSITPSTAHGRGPRRKREAL